MYEGELWDVFRRSEVSRPLFETFGVPEHDTGSKIVLHEMLMNYPDDPNNQWWYEDPKDSIAIVSGAVAAVAQKSDIAEAESTDLHALVGYWSTPYNRYDQDQWGQSSRSDTWDHQRYGEGRHTKGEKWYDNQDQDMRQPYQQNQQQKSWSSKDAWKSYQPGADAETADSTGDNL